jgi:uncharacterized protein (DUF849 family)
MPARLASCRSIPDRSSSASRNPTARSSPNSHLYINTFAGGGHLRVRLEDHFGDRQPSNVELVREVVELCAEVGRPDATPAQSCAILGVLATRQEV